MNLTIDLPLETSRILQHLAARKGKDLASFVQDVLEASAREAKLQGPWSDPQAAPNVSGVTFDQMAAPIRQGFDKAGLTEDELDNLFEEAREEVWQEEQQKGSR